MLNELLGRDLRIVDHDFGKDLFAKQGRLSDYGLIQGADNLGQAIKMRLLTPQGSYAHLGHPSYGSRLHELIGELNNDVNRKLAEMYVRRSLANEPRIKSINDVKVAMNEYSREIIDIHISVYVTQQKSPLNFVVNFSLEGESII